MAGGGWEKGLEHLPAPLHQLCTLPRDPPPTPLAPPQNTQSLTGGFSELGLRPRMQLMLLKQKVSGEGNSDAKAVNHFGAKPSGIFPNLPIPPDMHPPRPPAPPSRGLILPPTEMGTSRMSAQAVFPFQTGLSWVHLLSLRFQPSRHPVQTARAPPWMEKLAGSPGNERVVRSSKSPSRDTWPHGFMSLFKQAAHKSAAKEDLHHASQPSSWPNP